MPPEASQTNRDFKKRKTDILKLHMEQRGSFDALGDNANAFSPGRTCQGDEADPGMSRFPLKLFIFPLVMVDVVNLAKPRLT